MKTGWKQVMLMLGICVCLGGCGTEAEETKNQAKQNASNTENTVQMTEDTAQSEDKNFFPESYSEQTEKVKFECALTVPETFEATNFHAPVIKGRSYIDSETAYAKYVEGKAVSEEYHDEPTGESERESDMYILEDGTLVGLNEGFAYYRPEAATYQQVVRASERNAPKENFEFASGDDCTEQVRETLKEIGCPVEEYQFDWFSTSGEDFEILEQRALDDGMLESQNAKQGGWTDADNSYEIYGWQLYEGLPVLPQWMTSAMSRAVESYQKATVSAIYTEQGLLSLSLTEAPCVFERSEEVLEFLPFPEIADVVIQKYDELLDDTVYTVTYAKLLLRTYYDEKQQLQAEPIWYFEVTGGDSMEIVLVKAVTGEEIFLG